MVFTAGKILGPYEILEHIGAGGMGEVYRAKDRRLSRDVAIKVVREELVGDTQRLRRFEQEAKAAAAFHHPNICVLHEIGEYDGHHFIVMEYVEGRPLSQIIGGRPLPATQILDLAIQIADGLEEARSKGVVHRDIKPSNILVTPKGQAKILDFGLAKTALAPQTGGEISTVAEPMTQAGTLMGTYPYMSPEQALGQPADHRSDLFSFGIVLYEMATGRRPFEGATTMALLNEIINKTPASPVTWNPALPAALEPVLRKALEKDPERRYRTAAEMASDLKQLRHDTESGQNSPLVIAARTSRRSSRTMAILAAAAVAAAGVWVGFSRYASLGRAVQPASLYKLTQITRDSGLTYQPSISADGNFVVYASDRATGKDLDVWIQHVSGGQPVRLTSTTADESHPSISADGRTVAFQVLQQSSEKGIFIVPALGGTPKLLTPSGLLPRISPDALSVAYSTGEYFTPSEIQTVSTEGGPAKKVSEGLDWAMAPLWMEDKRNLLVWAGCGTRSTKGPCDYWMVPAAGGVASSTGADQRLRDAGASSMAHLTVAADPFPTASAGAGGVVIAARSGDGHDLWWIPMSDGKASSPATRITVGAGAAHPSVAATGRIAFSRLAVNTALWMLPLEASTGRVTGELQRVGRENASMNYPNVSADGKKLVYVSNRGGDPDVWVRDLETGTDRQLTSSKTHEFRAEISADGERVAYSAAHGLVTMPAGGGVEKLVCKDCGAGAVMWSPDGSKILSYWGSPVRHGSIDVATGQKQDLVWHPTADIHNGRYSPDGRWMTFTLVTEGSRVVYITSLENGAGGKPETWIRISGDALAHTSFWSPDGNLLYIHEWDGLWVRKLHPTTKAPVSAPTLIRKFDGPRYRPNFSANGITRSALYFMTLETTSNIWIADPAGR